MESNILNPALSFLIWIYCLLATIQQVNSSTNTSQVYIFLREEETLVGNVILSASMTMYLAKVYAKRGIYSVIIEESIEPSPEFFYPENMYSMSKSFKYFSLNEHTGLMKVNERLDFDNPEMEAAGCVRNEARETLELLQQDSLSSFKSTEYCCFPLEINGGGEETLALHVCIEDINDNAPEWVLSNAGDIDLNKNDSVMTLSIPENLPLDSTINIQPATDRDSGVNSALTYEIWPVIPEFDIIWNVTTSKLSLLLRKELDRENESSYNFTIVAHDGALESKSGSVRVAISVEDVNDNDPIFEELTYFVTIPEDTKISTPIVQVNATDPDLGINAEISYFISTLTDPEFSQMFSINENTGWIALEHELDFENYKQISLTIGATDMGEISRQSTCLVEINLTDVNDNAPKLLFEPGSLTNYALVPENEIAGRIVAVFTVVDEDSGANADTTCWIKSVGEEKMDLNSKIGNVAMFENENFKMEKGSVEVEIDAMDIESYFKLELMTLPFAKVYQLSTVAVFDREVGSKYRVGIMCADKGEPSQNTTGYVLVRIQDVNDHAPEFSNRHFTFRLPENQPVGEGLFKLTADDLDEGENATVSYSIITMDGTFTINNETGEVSLTKPLDYEKHTTHNFTVLAIDGGEQPLTGTVAVSVFVDDVNDNAPIVTSGQLLTVLESHSAGVIVGTLSAIDADSGLNGHFYYKIASIKPCFCGMPQSGEKSSDFNESLCTWAVEMVNKCDMDSVEQSYRLCSKAPLANAPSWTSKEYRRFLLTERGDVYLRYPNLDRETVPVYLIQGVVTDRGQPPMKTSICITVVVNDVNDCHPKFTFPALTNNTVLVKLPIHRGEPLVQLHATDYDIYENGELRFGFAEETDDTVANLFAIHPQSGLMVSKYSLQLKDLEYLAPSNSILKQAYTVKIKVTDMGTPPLISYASLRVRFQVRSDETTDKSFPSLQEQLLLEQHQLQNNEPYPSDLFNEYASGRAESTQYSDSTVWRSGMIFIILCVFFLVLLLILATLLLAIFTRRTLRPPPLNTHYPARIPIVTTTSAPITFRHTPSALLVSPLHHHQNHNYQRSGSSPTLPTAVPTPCHTLPLNYHLRHSEICASGGDLSLDSSAV